MLEIEYIEGYIMLEVVAAIIRKDEKFLICQRPANKNLGLL